MLFFRRDPAAELEPAHRALAQGEYEVAFAILEETLKRQRRRAHQARVQLQIAAIYALYEEDGVEGGLMQLKDAAKTDPAVVQWPLYRALCWEFAAYQGNRADARKGALAVATEDDVVAAYHAARALVAVSSYKRALKKLQAIDPTSLPEYLTWRCWSSLGQCYEATRQWVKAAEAYEQSASLSHGIDQQGELLHLAATWLEAGRARDALSALAGCDERLLSTIGERAWKLYLEGRCQLLLGNPNRALELLAEAQCSADEVADHLHHVLVSTAQAHANLGHVPQALEHYRQALDLAPFAERALIAHEYALLLLEDDQLLLAQETLQEVIRNEDYPFRAEVYADLSEVAFRLGNFHDAESLAHVALDLGAVARACLSLGHIAYEYYRLDEAVSWFEQAVSASQEGDTDWLSAQQMLADTFVQQGYKQPERVIHHAQAMLRYVPPGDEWRVILERYITQAKELLGGHTRYLN